MLDGADAGEHPFAPYVRALGKGPKMFRDLEEAEARAAMAMILAGEAEPLQVGAFLMLLRRKGETAAELAGFVRAAKETFPKSDHLVPADLDWPSYADRHRQQPWFILSALLLAQNGVRVLMHGIRGEEEGHAPTRAGLSMFGIRPVSTLEAAAREMDCCGFAYLATEEFSPQLDALFRLRRLLGVRSAVNTFARALNPMNASAQVVGVFHGAYRALHQEIAVRVGQPRSAVIKGVGGEFQRSPFKEAVVSLVRQGQAVEEVWPVAARPGSAPYRWRDENLDPMSLVRVWRGDGGFEVPRRTIIATVALTLRLIGAAQDAVEATARSETMWRSRQQW